MRSRERRLRPQPWPWIGARRVLVEHPDESTGMALASALREAGYAVALCPGPSGSRRCPLLGSDGCVVAEDADAVVSCLELDDAQAREVLRALRLHHPSAAVVVGVSPQQVVAAVDEALAESRAESGDRA